MIKTPEHFQRGSALDLDSPGGETFPVARVQPSIEIGLQRPDGFVQLQPKLHREALVLHCLLEAFESSHASNESPLDLRTLLPKPLTLRWMKTIISVIGM